MRTISIPPTKPPPFGDAPAKWEWPVTPPTAAPRTLPVIWIPPLQPFNPFEGASDDQLDGLFEDLEEREDTYIGPTPTW